MQALYQNMIFRNGGVDLSKAPPAAKNLCLALGACHGGTPKDDTFLVASYTNNVSMPTLNLERLNHWVGPPLTDEKIFEVYDLIINNKHSNITEGMALSKFSYHYYGDMLYATQFKADITSLLRMFNMNEEKVPVSTILSEHGMKLKVSIKQSFETSDRFREIIKYCLVHHHMVALNTRFGIKRLNETLDNLMNEYKKEVLDEFEES